MFKGVTQKIMEQEKITPTPKINETPVIQPTIRESLFGKKPTQKIRTDLVFLFFQDPLPGANRPQIKGTIFIQGEKCGLSLWKKEEYRRCTIYTGVLQTDFRVKLGRCSLSMNQENGKNLLTVRPQNLPPINLAMDLKLKNLKTFLQGSL